MYTVNEQKFSSYLKAVAAANLAGAEVFDENGVRRWAPAAAVSKKAVRRYNEQLAAYNAQQKSREVSA
jgi:hypothetical protein